jgi:hypothetical protein
MDMKFGTQNVKSLCKAVLLMTVAKGISKYKLDLMGVQEVRCNGVNDRMSYIIIVLNVHAPTGDKIDDMKGSSYEELEHIFDKFLKYRTKIW